MPLFEYRAVDPDGKAVEGTMDEPSARRVTEILTERGLQVNSVKEAGKRFGLVRLRSRLTWDDIDLLNRELLAINKSGLPFAPSLKALGQDISNRRLRPVLADIHAQLEAGSSLEEAFSRHPESFSPVYRSMLRAGERTGNLTGVLSHLCAYSARMVEVKNAVQEALAYPVFVVIAACIVLWFLMIKVVPTFAAIFKEFGGQLPGLTQLLVDVSNFLMDQWVTLFVWVGVGLIVVSTAYKFWHRTDTGGFVLDWTKIHVPVFGRLYEASSMARFSRSLGLLLSSNVPVLEALDLASATAGNDVLRRAATDAAQSIAGGERMADAFESTGRFSHSFCWLLATAEERGEVGSALVDLADSFEGSTGRIQRTIVTLMGPLTIIALGILVGFIVLALYLPILILGDAIT